MSNSKLVHLTPKELAAKGKRAITFAANRVTDPAAKNALGEVLTILETLEYNAKLAEDEIRALYAQIEMHVTFEDELVAVEVDRLMQEAAVERVIAPLGSNR